MTKEIAMNIVGTSLALSGTSAIISLIVAIIMLAAWWKVFSKAGHPGWGILIPIYNVYLMCKTAQRPGWWWLLYIIPFVNIVVAIIVAIDIAKSFQKGAGFGIGVLLLPVIFVSILGFGGATYNRALEKI